MIALALVLLSLTWLPLAGGDAELAHRFRLAIAIVDAGTTPHEGRILMRIARFASELVERDADGVPIAFRIWTAGVNASDDGDLSHIEVLP